MYAIVEIAGQQFKVEQGKKIFVHRQSIPEGEVVEFDQVLLLEDGDKITIGEPTIEGMVVEGKILDNTVRGEKVIVFKKKRRKGYRVKNGHRQDFTQVEILRIGAKKAKKTLSKEEKPANTGAKPVEAKAEEAIVAEPTVKKAAPKKTEKAVAGESATKKTAAKKSEKAAAAEPTAKKAAPKKPAAKKPAAKKPTAKKSGPKGSTDKE